jgi:hypothetical protein
MNTTLSLPFDKPAPYEVVAVAEPAATDWLHLPSLHAKLLPLAKAAGHERLTLSCDHAGADDFQTTYSASASGGPAGFRYYIPVINLADAGHLPEHFERVLTAKLEQQVAFLAGQGKEQADV